mgnify:CR=1 FL=1
MQDDQESTPARSTASNVANNAAKDVSTDAKDIEVETKEEESDVIWEPTPKDILLVFKMWVCFMFVWQRGN